MGAMLGSFARLAKIARFVLLQTFQRNIISLKRSRLFSPATQPDACKVISRKTYLYPSRVFKPKVKDADPVPLVVMVHGGGFVMNNPSVDEPLARFLADNCNCIVVSIDYRKAPIHPFPAAYEDVVESVSALLASNGLDLPVDHSKVILCGSSAGGNLVLAAAQDTRLRKKLLGIIALYPVVNFVPTMEEQIATRPDANVPDFLGPMWNDVLNVYVGTTDVTALEDARISPTNFQKRDDLPSNIFWLGCEHDMLCHEAKIMAKKLCNMDASVCRQLGDVHWTLVKGQTHAFDVFPKKLDKDEEIRVREKDSMFQSIAQWIRQKCVTGLSSAQV